MSTPDPNWRQAQIIANTAALQKSVKDYQSNQLKSLAPLAATTALVAAFAAKDRLRAVNDAFAARDHDQLFQIRKQQWITNKLLEGWSMEDINEEIAAGEALAAAEERPPVDPFPWGSLLLIVLGALGLTVALIYGFTHPNDGISSP